MFKEIYLLKYIWLCKNYIAPIDGMLSVLIKRKDYKTYVELVDIFIHLFNQNNTENKCDEILDKIFHVYSDITVEGLRKKVRDFHISNFHELSDNQFNIDKVKDFKDFHLKENYTIIDKINYSIKKINDIDSFINTKYPDEDSNNDLFNKENKLSEKLIKFIKKYQALDERETNSDTEKKEKIFSFFIVSTEFFHAIHHLAFYIFNGEDSNNNLQKAETHLERANRDLVKLELFLEQKLDLESFRKRIDEINNINIF